MLRLRSAVQFVVVGVLSLAGAACKDIAAPVATPGDRATATISTASAEGQHRGWTIDHEFARIAREEIPGFAGYFVDEAGRFTIQLKNPGQGDRAITAISRAFARQAARGVPSPDVASARILQARYDYTELTQWRDRARHVLGLSGIHSLAIDDVRNRLQIGIEREADRSRAVAQLAMLGIPSGAVAVEVRERVVPAIDLPSTQSTVSPQYIAPGDSDGGGGTGGAVKTLEDPYYRPLVGGLRIWWYDDSVNKYFPCTYGVNVKGRYFTAPQFATAAHCSKIFGFSDATRMYQAELNYGQVANGVMIGYEREDPAYSSAPSSQGRPCTTGRCRNSDVALSVLQTFDFEFGKIAKTQVPHRYEGSKVIAGRFRIVAAYEVPFAPPYTGMPLDKVGATTGWTNGTVSTPCEDVTYEIKGWLYTFFCQTRVSAGAASGDSGAPVFRRGDFDDVYFYGILTAGTSASYLFSSYQNILADEISMSVYQKQ
ncbi:MAG TPA: hypothetical protein VGR37_08775 [Longimicrobiaceae bacterium]|nr:hypothetical protein [Longimicrobiaceae bacterium]